MLHALVSFICLSSCIYRSNLSRRSLSVLQYRRERLLTVWNWRWASGVPRVIFGVFTRYLYATTFLWKGHTWFQKISVCHQISVKGAYLTSKGSCMPSHSCERGIFDFKIYMYVITFLWKGHTWLQKVAVCHQIPVKGAYFISKDICMPSHSCERGILDFKR